MPPFYPPTCSHSPPCTVVGKLREMPTRMGKMMQCTRSIPVQSHEMHWSGFVPLFRVKIYWHWVLQGLVRICRREEDIKGGLFGRGGCELDCRVGCRWEIRQSASLASASLCRLCVQCEGRTGWDLQDSWGLVVQNVVSSSAGFLISPRGIAESLERTDRLKFSISYLFGNSPFCKFYSFLLCKQSHSLPWAEL